MRSSPILLQLLLCVSGLAETFDYVVVGAGTAGLVIANRLSENSAVTVAVIEPGGDERENPQVKSASSFLQAFNTRVDWNYRTVNQPFVNNRPQQYHQGKGIGGTSIINGMNYIRAEKAEIDALEKLGNPGWNWNTLFPYYKRNERFTVPSEAQAKAGIKYKAENRGGDGPVRTGFPFDTANSTYGVQIRQTWANVGLPDNQDSSGGDVHGVSSNPLTIDRDAHMRWDAARAYWIPAEGRSNLKMIRGTARKIVWRTGTSGAVQASGVEYLTAAGEAVVVDARKEVVLSAGSLRSPAILEASGVGNPRVLQPLGINVTVNLPGVGENLQEQPNTSLNYVLRASLTGQNVMQAYATAADVFGSSTRAVAAATLANITAYAKLAVDASGGPTFVNQTAVEVLMRVQHDLLFNQNVTAAEYLTFVRQGGSLSLNFWWLYPFSRGSVHLSRDSLADASVVAQPTIDPRLNMVPFDVTAQGMVAKLADKFSETSPIKDIKTSRGGLGANPTNTQWEDFARSGTAVNSHNLGTASMMKRELGGVVDPELKVYGTRNVRVVDMSIFPLQFSGHPQSTLYAVAERAAEIIKRASL
ncbi:glucose oxidase [Pyricularia oryzae 70-15]|uniref:Glucose oxidase n=3 Tax=Pyricularia oryzae TaxID=318829 RepID=G4N2I1_PYRO7|nr:glucose oxidase [Pyricularia oryzae 70-15]EHA51690.1 glucose oxidase [Pyricularia oryzae 70-15]ELQ42898.1 glucose oxidase [Pyricularia oryzae Y34]KAI7912673.1 glucose oxidase [Pyricularia oryzae]KAI7913484.1 glucose oxidase [Pyricularia oryzae]